MAKVQKVYTKEFKEEAVKLARNSNKPAAQIARDLGMSDSALYLWQRKVQMPSPALGIKVRKKKKSAV